MTSTVTSGTGGGNALGGAGGGGYVSAEEILSRHTPLLNKALAAVQAELPEIRKKAEVKKGRTSQGKEYGGYKYADLADVSKVIMPLLGKHGLAFSAQPTLKPDGMFVLAYSLLHVSGSRIDGEYPLPSPITTSPQQVGSAITYARRYCLCAVAGIAPYEDDDDGQAAQQGHEENDRRLAAREAAINVLKDRVKEVIRQPPGDKEAEQSANKAWEAINLAVEDGVISLIIANGLKKEIKDWGAKAEKQEQPQEPGHGEYA